MSTFARLDLVPAGVFLTRPFLVNATVEEITAATVAPERFQEIGHALADAARTLRDMPTEGHC